MTSDHAALAGPRAEPAIRRAAIDPFRRRAVRVLMGLVMFLTGTYVGVDGAAFQHHFSSPYPAGAGYARTVLCAFLVALIGPAAAIDRRDLGLLRAAFAVTLIADYFLILRDSMIPGTLLFLVVHGLLVYRHARGFRDALQPKERRRTLVLSTVTGVVAFGGSAALIVGFHDVLARTHMLALDAVYLILLATSLWMAWGTLIRRAFPTRNAWYIVIGMTCFYFCDVSVGLAAALTRSPAGQVLSILVGFFYSPALVLLAYSGFRWRGSDGASPASAR